MSQFLLKGEMLKSQIKQLSNNWHLVEEHHIEKDFSFKNFKEALDFTNLVGDLAESEKHHPDIYLTYGKVKIKIYNHKVNGLTEKDFNLAKKIDNLKI